MFFVFLEVFNILCVVVFCIIVIFYIIYIGFLFFGKFMMEVWNSVYIYVYIWNVYYNKEIGKGNMLFGGVFWKLIFIVVCGDEGDRIV